jgi:hypothetical protein
VEPGEIQPLVEAVGPEGLCITTTVETEKEARALLDRFGWKSNF